MNSSIKQIPIVTEINQKELIDSKRKTPVCPFIYFGKKIVPQEYAVVSLASHSLQYGSTVFAGIRGYFRDGQIRVFRLKDHYIRLMNASKIMGYNYYISFEDFEAIISALIKVNKPQCDVYFRPFIMCDQIQLGPKMINGMEFDLAVYICELGDYAPQRGLKLKISATQKYSDNAISTKAKVGGSYVNSFAAVYEACKDGYDEILITDNQGFIVEANVANIIGVYRGQLISPPTTSSALDGITLRSVKELLELEGHTVKEYNIDKSTAYCLDELIITGTAMKVAYTESIDGRKLGNMHDEDDWVNNNKPGAFASLAIQKFTDVIEMKHPKSKEWISLLSI